MKLENTEIFDPKTGEPYDHDIPHPLWRVTFDFGRDLDGATGQALFDALEALGVSVFLHNKEATDGDSWSVSVTTYGEPDLGALHAAADAVVALPRDKVAAEKLPQTDWLQHVHDNFPPVTIGDFFIYGSHYEGDLPGGLIALQIDAATAFGSGEHETTRGCLEALQELRAQGVDFANALDMGCGSGILAIGLVKLWPQARVVAVDIDPESVIVTERHAGMNDCGGAIVAQAGDGYAAPIVDMRAPYDVVTANILAGPLVEMAPDLNAVLKDGGYAILSGLLKRQKDEVVAAHTALGLRLVKAVEIGDWQALVLRKGG